MQNCVECGVYLANDHHAEGTCLNIYDFVRAGECVILLVFCY